MRNWGLQKLFRKERVSQNTQTRFLPWENESKGFAPVIPQSTAGNLSLEDPLQLLLVEGGQAMDF